MNKTHNITAVLGEYKNDQGEIKKRYAKIGALFSRDDGSLAIKMDTVPVGDEWNGWLNLYPDDYKKEAAQPSPQPQQGYQPSPQSQPPQPQAQQSYQAANQNDDIPF